MGYDSGFGYERSRVQISDEPVLLTLTLIFFKTISPKCPRRTYVQYSTVLPPSSVLFCQGTLTLAVTETKSELTGGKIILFGSSLINDDM